MKSLVLIFSGILIVGCAANEEEKNPIQIETTDIPVEVERESNKTEPEPGEYKEYHEDGSLKIEGKLDKNGQRTGLWMSYYPDSTKWSESYYVKGKRDGHSITFYENGRIRYVGEYKNDKQVGEWKFYSEAGEETEVKNYDQK